MYQRRPLLEGTTTSRGFLKMYVYSVQFVGTLTLTFCFILFFTVAVNYSAQMYWAFNRQIPDAKGKYFS